MTDFLGLCDACGAARFKGGHCECPPPPPATGPSVDVFWRTWNRKRENENTRAASFPYDGDVRDLDALIKAAWEAGASRGNGRTGVFEIQTHAGVWSHPDGHTAALVDNKGKRHPGAVFKTWEEMEADERAGAVAC